MRDDPPLTADAIAALRQRATARAAAGDELAEAVLVLLRERGRLRVVSRKVLATLPDDVLITPDAQELLVLVGPWPTCVVKKAT